MEEGGNKRKHPGWQYIILDDPKDTNTCKCVFCGKITKGGVCQATNHLVGGNRNVKACLKCPTNVREESNALPTYEDLTLIEEDDEDEMEVVGGSGSGTTSTPMNKRTRINTGHNVSSMGGRGRGSGSGNGGGSSNSCSPSVLKPPRPKGPIDKFVYQHPGKVIDDRNRLKRLKQSTITEKYDKEGRDATVQFIVRWIYQAGIPLNTIRLRSFEVMLEAVGQFGPGLIPPSYHEARVTYLKKEVQYTKNLMGDHEVEWKRNGCSLMSDGWTDRRDRTLINFLVHSSVGTLFMESIDASSCIKTGEKIFQLLDGMVEKIGEENVVQVVTDNASNYVLAGKLLEAKRPHLYWTPCAAHCLDLILEDIGKIEQVKRCLRKAVALSGSKHDE